MDMLIRLEEQAEQVEVMEMRKENTLVEYEANQLKSCAVAETKGAAVRVIRAGRQGFAATTNAGAMDRLAANALESARFGDIAAYSFAAPSPAGTVRTYDRTVAELSVKRLASIGEEILELVLAVEPAARCNVRISRSLVDVRIRNNRGLDVAYQSSPLAIDLWIDRFENDDVLVLYDQLGTTIWEDDYAAFARRLAGKLKLAGKVASVAPGRMPVLFSPVGAQALGVPLFEGLNGREVFSGTSPVADKAGEKILDSRISIVDDGTIDGKFASSTYDDEGVPRRRNVLIEKGRLNGFVYDLKTAAQSGVESTGNASRDLFSAPVPGFSNLSIEPGETPLRDMVAGIDEGIIVEGVLGLGMGNTISGAFSNPLALAFKIEKGEIVGRAKDLSIAGNVYEILKDVAAVSRETEWVYGSYRAPYILVPDMNVAGKAG